MSALANKGFKQTEIGVIPEDWHCSKISEVCVTSSGTTPARSQFDRYFRNGQINWVKTLDLNNSEILKTDEQVTIEALAETSLKLYPVKTVLVAMYGGFNQIGRTGILRVPACVNQAITAIQCENQLSPEYLLATLNFRVEHWKAVASSSRKDPNITSQDVRDFQIAYPSRDEQEKIAETLSCIDSLIRSLDQLIAKKRDIQQATMQQLLTGQRRLPGFSGEWEEKRLGDHLSFLKNGTNSRAELSTEGDVHYLHYGDIHGSQHLLLNPAKSSMPCLPRDKAKRLDRLENGDVIFADASEDLDGVGKSVEVQLPEGMELVSGLHTIAVRFDKKVISDGFKAYLQFIPTFRSHLRQLAAGTKVYATSRAHIASAEVEIPEIEEQTAIASILSEMDTELAALETRRDKARQIKQGMMQELLTGRIRLV
ncbi:restriction endonuclease subunit S [Pseudomonas aeruginosa]|nr:restriction endonuclease subunit S [Pseudomonas aeruginosa]MDI3672346.1 restriction endonuclease subunit S [Pseudomonas aeruginosa]MDI3702570.1 restriction endonuclease subunit S [Pseudomonas aeruginosa]MDI3756869.1 restriction endonuclease subunit S [Pseudomonas aeruginosa]MDI3775803.1 restriction endonuclease subunit S [Pseudomonas aeruginosa]